VDSLLAYRLAKVFENTAELGAAGEFLATALRLPNRAAPDRIDERKPEALLDYADVVLKLRAYSEVLSIVSFFENEYWSNERSRTLRIKAYIGANQFDDAEEELAHIPTDDPNTIKLNLALVRAKITQVRRAIAQKQREKSSDVILPGLPGEEKEGVESPGADELMTVELSGYLNVLAELVGKLLEIEPNSVGAASIVAVCNNYIREGKTSEAKDLVNRFLGYFPDNTAALLYKQILSEPDPGKLIELGQDEIAQQRRKEIEEEVLLNIADPIRRSVNLGVFYQRNKELEKASEEFKKVLKIEALQEGIVEVPAFDQTKEIADSQRLAASYLFEIALGAEDWELASAIGDVARRENIDECAGKFFAARLAMAKAEYKNALARVEEGLKQRPVFSHGFMLRSNINAALGNEHTSIEDIQKAASLNPLDGNIAKRLAFVLYERNRKLGNNVNPDQMIEVRSALINAMRLNPMEWRLQSLYAEHISEENTTVALAIRQRLQRAFPSVENALLLGNMAVKRALREANAEQKELLFGVAASSFQQLLLRPFYQPIKFIY